MRREQGSGSRQASAAFPLGHAFAVDGLEAREALGPAEATACEDLPAWRQSDHRAGRLAAKRALTDLYGGSLHPALLRVRSGAGQAPRADVVHRDGARALNVSLSIAHRDGRALAAACRRPGRVGVDLERRGQVLPSQLSRFLGVRELQGAGGLDATLLWTLKEAAWKALGLSASVSFKSLELVFRGGELIGLRWGARCWLAEARALPTPSGHHAVVVIALPRRRP